MEKPRTANASTPWRRIAEIRRAPDSCPKNEVDEIPGRSAAKIKDGIRTVVPRIASRMPRNFGRHSWGIACRSKKPGQNRS